MLGQFEVRNFKSYRRAQLPLGPLTLLVGANASGKSNILEALQMLSWLAQGRRLDEVFNAVQRSELSIRGTISNLVYESCDRFQLGCSLRHASPYTELEIVIRIDAERMRIDQERLWSLTEDIPLYLVEQPAAGYSHDLAVSYNNFSRGRNKPQITCTDQQAVFTQLLTPARFADEHQRSQQEVPAVAERFMRTLQDVLFLDPAPRAMRGYSFVADKFLKGDGGNVSSVLYDLCQTKALKHRLLDFIRDLPEQDITDITFLEGPRREVMLQLEESFGGTRKKSDAPVASDGTLRVLAVAAALLSVPRGSTVVIEEIDNGVHPSRAKGLLANIQSIARRHSLAVLLTTHNPALLDALPESALPDVVFCYRDPAKGDSRLVRLKDLPRYPELIAQGPLGRLMTQGVLDAFAKDSRTEDEMMADKLAWIEHLDKEPSR